MDNIDCRVGIPARVLLEQGLWIEACDLLGLDEWAINEGKMDEEEMIYMNREQAITLGVFKS